MYVIELRNGSYLGPYEDRGVPIAQATRYPTQEAAEAVFSDGSYMLAGPMVVPLSTALTAPRVNPDRASSRRAGRRASWLYFAALLRRL